MDNNLYAAGRQYLERESCDLQAPGRRPGRSRTRTGALAQAVGAVHEWDEAIDYAERALAGYRKLDDPFRVGWGLYMIAGLHSRLGDWRDAATELRESTEIFSAARDQSGILFNLAALAMAAQASGHHEASLRIGGAVDRYAAQRAPG